MVSTVNYFPFGATRTSSGTLNTDELFTGQRLDQTGLYYYGARYYDANIGRFISADSIVQSLVNPQCLNRYSYCLNNPLKYIDPDGRFALLFAAPLAVLALAPVVIAQPIAVTHGDTGAAAALNAAISNGYNNVKDLFTASSIPHYTSLSEVAEKAGAWPVREEAKAKAEARAKTEVCTTTLTRTQTQTRTRVERPFLVYRLVATMDTKYDRWKYGMIPQKNAVRLRPGEVWKYGITSQFTKDAERRYPQWWLTAHHLKLERILYGTEAYCRSMEKALILSYKYHHGGFLPPGNKIVG